MYLIDGPMLLAEACAAEVELEVVYVEPDALDHPAVWTARRDGVRVRDVTPGALAKVLELTTPQQMVAVAAQRPTELDDLIAAAQQRQRPILVLVELADPGNTGTLVRVAEASGCAGVALTTNSVDLFNPKTVRATAGALFRVPVSEGNEVDTLIRALTEAGIPIVATVGGAGPAPEQVALDRAVALLVGNEAHGLSDGVVAACSTTVTIPMEGSVESLNAAVAGSVVAFEAARQRRAAGPGAHDTEPSGGAAAAVSNNDGPTRPSDVASAPHDDGEHSNE